MKLTDFLNEQSTLSDKALSESESNYVAMASYKTNVAKALDELEMLKLNIQRHQARYMQTDRKDWGYAGDMERLRSQLTDINDWMRK